MSPYEQKKGFANFSFSRRHSNFKFEKFDFAHCQPARSRNNSNRLFCSQKYILVPLPLHYYIIRVHMHLATIGLKHLYTIDLGTGGKCEKNSPDLQGKQVNCTTFALLHPETRELKDKVLYIFCTLVLPTDRELEQGHVCPMSMCTSKGKTFPVSDKFIFILMICCEKDYAHYRVERQKNVELYKFVQLDNCYAWQLSMQDGFVA